MELRHLEVGVRVAAFGPAMIVLYLSMLCLALQHLMRKSQRATAFLVTHLVSDASALFISFLCLFFNTEPPLELMQQVFPWIEEKQAALEARSTANPNARDFALKQFLTLLKWLRRVLLQDVAVLSTSSYGTIPLFAFAPFNTAAFQTFASGSATVIQRAAEDARLQLQNLPDQFAHTFRGLLANHTLEQQRIITDQNRKIEDLTQIITNLVGLSEMQSASKKSQRRHTSRGQSV